MGREKFASPGQNIIFLKELIVHRFILKLILITIKNYANSKYRTRGYKIWDTLFVCVWNFYQKNLHTSPKGANSINLGSKETHLITVALRITL